MPKITITHQDGSQDRYALDGKLFKIGRAPDNDIVLPDGSSSAFHAVLKRTESGDFSISDLGSTNHTRVNGLQVTTQDLRDGDRLLFGDTLAEYESEITPPSPPPGAEPAPATAAASAADAPAATPPPPAATPAPAGNPDTGDTTTSQKPQPVGCLGLVVALALAVAAAAATTTAAAVVSRL